MEITCMCTNNQKPDTLWESQGQCRTMSISEKRLNVCVYIYIYHSSLAKSVIVQVCNITNTGK